MKLQRYGIKIIKLGKNIVFIPKIIPDGYGEKFVREKDAIEFAKSFACIYLLNNTHFNNVDEALEAFIGN